MKKIIAVALAAFALNASAFTGTGNDKIEEAKDYLKIDETNKGSTLELQNYAYIAGAIAGLSDVYAEPAYPAAICYPKEATLGQISEIAARYLIDHPEKRADNLSYLVWTAHLKAFGLQMVESCWLHDRWLEANS